jgi:hypothetical protein
MPSSRCRVDGVEVDAAIQDERAVNLISTQVRRRPVHREVGLPPRRGVPARIIDEVGALSRRF